MNKAFSAAHLIAFSVLFSTSVQAEPFAFVLPSQLHIFAMDNDSVVVRFGEHKHALRVAMRHDKLPLLYLAAASASSLDEFLVIDLNEDTKIPNPNFYVGRRKDTFKDGWLLDARFIITESSIQDGSERYFFDKKDGSAPLQIFSHPGKDSQFANVLARGPDGFIRVSESANPHSFDLEFIPFEYLATFETRNVSSIGSVQGQHALLGNIVRLALKEGDMKWVRTLGQSVKAICTFVACTEQQRQNATLFRTIGPKFSLK